MPETILSLKNGYVEVDSYNNDIKTSKTISYESLKALAESNTNAFESPFLPGTYGVQKMFISNERHIYLYTEPPRIITCKYNAKNSRYDEPDVSSSNDGLHENQFVCPSLAWFIVLCPNGDGTFRLYRNYVMALKGNVISGNETLYHAPFANIYGDGNICWGDIDIQVPTPKAIQGLSARFFNAIANTDLDNNRFLRFQRKHFSGEAFYTLHLQMETDKMLEEDEPEKVLSFVHDVLVTSGYSYQNNVNNFFEYLKENS